LDKQLINKLRTGLNRFTGVVGKDKYFNSAVLIPLILVDNEYHLLFEKRAKGIRQGGEVSFPGGEFDSLKDSTYLDAALRETNEEISIPKNEIKILGQMGTLIAPMGVSVDSFIGIINDLEFHKIKIDKSEVEKIFTVPLSYFLQNEPKKYAVRLEVKTFKDNPDGTTTELLPVKMLKLPRQYESTWKGRKQRVLVYEGTEEIIWGITAELIYQLCKIIQDS